MILKQDSKFVSEKTAPLETLKRLLLKVEKPGRYTGGEFGSLASASCEKKKVELKTVIAFPDLYEIGMGNQALKIIYNKLNNIPDILCDRAFAPAPDFEKILKENKIPLYGLDTKLFLNQFDLLMFTLGYELCLNGVLTMLDTSRIPLRARDRSESHPIIIAGGPVVSNPLPFSPFIDAFWIGEAEAGFFDLSRELAQEKSRGADRDSLLEKIRSHPNIWVKGKKKAARAVYSSFSTDTESFVYPIPSMKIIQNHGVIEIMRGCPNGCRFCHAGFWYRPMRQKNAELILQEAEELADKGGWHSISLSSLSSGDYSGIVELAEELNFKFKKRNVSIQLPSLKVSGFSLNLLEKISVTRKSGLTFAVETPLEARQMSINKEVARDSVVSILEEAKKRGWKSAKFYFMIGLPKYFNAERAKNAKDDAEEILKEEEEIVNFIIDISKRTRMKFNINAGVFIPKPHTPYQWDAQIDCKEAEDKLYYICSKLKPLGHKVSASDLLISKIEGLLSRGDERAGYLCEKAYLEGSRLDAWNEYINRDKWREILDNNEDLVNEALSKKTFLPWDCVDSGVTKEYFKCEEKNSNNSKLTLPCSENCVKCGVCSNNIKIHKNSPHPPRPANQRFDALSAANASNAVNLKNNKVNNDIYRLIFSFSKQYPAIYHGHLSLIEIFSMSLRRAGISVLYTQGFNPLAKMEFASPLSTGIASLNEIALVNFLNEADAFDFTDKLNKSLPDGIKINREEIFYIPFGVKRHSLSSLLWGFVYEYAGGNKDYVSAKEDKIYRKDKNITELKRIEILAKDKESYFDAYKSLYN